MVRREEKNLKTYTGIMVLFSLIVTVIILLIFESISIQSKFGCKNLSLGHYIVSKYDYNKDKGELSVNFRMSNAETFIEKHVIAHEDYQYQITFEDNRLNDYYVFSKEHCYFTLRFDQTANMFALYSGYLIVEFNNESYAVPYIDLKAREIDIELFPTYQDLKAFYLYLADSVFEDDLKLIHLKAYSINPNTFIVNENAKIDVVIDYHDQNQIVVRLP